MLYDSYYLTVRKGKVSETVKRPVLARGLRRVIEKWISTEVFYDGETILYDAANICIHTFILSSKSIKCTIQKLYPITKLGLQLIKTYWFINCDKCTTVMEVVNNRRNCEGLWGNWESRGVFCKFSLIFL